MLENNQKELILLEDLGMLFLNETSKHKIRIGIYRCTCGKEFKTAIQSVKQGNTRSCGCYREKATKERLISKNTTHGLTKHRIYIVWRNMMSRCYNKNNCSYKDYGQRGITVCEEWHDVKNFIEDMYPTFIEGLTIDRKENDLGYSKDNCRWTAKNIQSRNTRIIRNGNTSGYRGVSYEKSKNKYSSFIYLNNKRIYLGHFDNPLDAAKAYDKYVIDNNLEHSRNGVYL